MNYVELKTNILQKTINFIENKNWDKILYILQNCPKQIYFYKSLLESKLRNS